MLIFTKFQHLLALIIHLLCRWLFVGHCKKLVNQLWSTAAAIVQCAANAMPFLAASLFSLIWAAGRAISAEWRQSISQRSDGCACRRRCIPLGPASGFYRWLEWSLDHADRGMQRRQASRRAYPSGSASRNCRRAIDQLAAVLSCVLPASPAITWRTWPLLSVRLCTVCSESHATSLVFHRKMHHRRHLVSGFWQWSRRCRVSPCNDLCAVCPLDLEVVQPFAAAHYLLEIQWTCIYTHTQSE